MAQVAYTNVAEGTGLKGSILADKNFFLVQRLPQRSRFLSLVEANGGSVVKLEKQADYIIADHVRADAPPGSLSYTFLEAAIAQGELPEESKHIAGRAKNTPRPVGSAAPGKTTRTPFTTEDDRQLYEWVKSAELAGVSIKGNELYKQLEAKNPRHTFQSWRARYISHLAFKTPASLPTPPLDQSTANVEVDTTRTEALAEQRPTSSSSTARRTGSSMRPKGKAPVAQAANGHASTPEPADALRRPAAPEQETIVSPAPTSKPVLASTSAVVWTDDSQQIQEDVVLDGEVGAADLIDAGNEEPFADENIDEWVEGAAAIQDIAVGQYQTAWMSFAKHHPEHTAEEWRAFYENKILPIYLEERADESNLEGSAEQDGLQVAEVRTRYWDIQRAFGTQGQPFYPPSQTPSAAVTPQKSAQLKTSAGPAKGKPLLREELIVESPKRKFSRSDPHIHSSGDSQKRRRVEEISTRDIPAHTVPLSDQEAVVISSDSASADDGEDDEERNNLLTSDVDLAVQRQLLGEMQQERGELTAINLARIEAQHNPPSTRRGVDLTEDDEDKDQGDFAGYLEELLKTTTTGQEIKADAVVDKHVSQENDLLQETGIPRLVDTQLIDPDLDMSSPLHQPEEEPRQPLDPDMSPLPSCGPILTQDLDPDLFIDDDIQLELPEPEGGWEPYSSQTSQRQFATIDAFVGNSRNDAHRGRIVDTQDIFDGETQELDLGIPDPGTFSSQLDRDKPLPEPTVESQTISDDDVDGYIDELIKRGFQEPDIVTALECTSMRPELVELVIVHLAKSRNIPTNIAGVWTAEEDRDLEGGNAVKLKALVSKHGTDEFDARMKFLDDYRSE